MPTATAGLNAPPEMLPSANAIATTVKPDGEGVKGIDRRALSCGNVQHDVGERKRADEFRDERVANIRVAGRKHRRTFEQQRDFGGGGGGEDLRDEIERNIAGGAASAQPDDEHGGTGVNDRRADGQDEKEGADEFNEVFFHEVVSFWVSVIFLHAVC